MAAHNDKFPWLSYYGGYDFFEQRMYEHSKVSSITKIGIGLYSIKLFNKKQLKVFICECYSFGCAEYLECVKNYGPLDAVIISSNWCGYSLDVKHECMKNEVGVFDIKGFMAAVNKDKYWNHLNEEEKKQFKEYGWL